MIVYGYAWLNVNGRAFFKGNGGLLAWQITDFADADENLYKSIVTAIDRLVEQDADTVVLGGSYFIGKDKALSALLTDEKYKDLVIIDPSGHKICPNVG